MLSTRAQFDANLLSLWTNRARLPGSAQDQNTQTYRKHYGSSQLNQVTSFLLRAVIIFLFILLQNAYFIAIFRLAIEN